VAEHLQRDEHVRELVGARRREAHLRPQDAEEHSGPEQAVAVVGHRVAQVDATASRRAPSPRRPRCRPRRRGPRQSTARQPPRRVPDARLADAIRVEPDVSSATALGHTCPRENGSSRRPRCGWLDRPRCDGQPAHGLAEHAGGEAGRGRERGRDMARLMWTSWYLSSCPKARRPRTIPARGSSRSCRDRSPRPPRRVAPAVDHPRARRAAQDRPPRATKRACGRPCIRAELRDSRRVPQGLRRHASRDADRGVAPADRVRAARTRRARTSATWRSATRRCCTPGAG